MKQKFIFNPDNKKTMNEKKNPQPSGKANNNVAKTVNKKEDDRKC
jgi:hypothetical protein